MLMRPATPADLPAIVALQRRNWRAVYRDLVPAELLRDPLDRWLAEVWCAEALGQGVRLVMRDVDGLAGFVAFDPDHADGVHVENLHVRATAWGQGVGAALMAAVAWAAKGRPLWLEVLAGNRGARAVYRRWGGVEGPVFEDRLLGAPVPAHRVIWHDAEGLRLRLEAPRRRASRP